MFYEAQLRLLRDTFKKCRIPTDIADFSGHSESDVSLQLHSFWTGEAAPIYLLRQTLTEIKSETVYRLQDFLDCRYIFLQLPGLPTDAALSIGPYLSEPPTELRFMEWAESKGIPPRQQTQLKNYYTTLPILPDTSHLFAMLDAFYELLWGATGFTVEYLDWHAPAELLLFPEKKASAENADALWQMKAIEQRYNYENELISAVSKGQLHKANVLLSNVSTVFFEQRVPDPVRNAKNYCIIMNTLLRKAAEQGGVHPIHLDNTSSAYATKIEQLSTLENISSLMAEMFRGYCLLVRKHAMGQYSPPVQQVIISIDANLSGELNLHSLSQKLNMSSSYLSTIFKKETGKTLTDYIAQRRVDKAMELLRTTRLQVQTIAQHCGIMDVHYFSRIFKKITGQTPKAYRESLQK